MKEKVFTPPYNWTDDKDEIVRVKFGKVPAWQIGQELEPKASAKQVYRRARQLGLTSVRYGWSLADDKIIYDNADKMHPSEIRKLLSRDRSEDCISWRIHRLGIKVRNAGEWLHAASFATMTGINRHWVGKLIELGFLKATRYNSNKPSEHGWYKIKKEDAIDFCRKYPCELQGRNVDMILLIDTLVGVKNKLPTNGRYYPDA